METTTIPAVHRSVTVNAPSERAFTLFTRDISAWRPMASHHIGAVDCAEIRIDERAGGRWYEVGVDGTECDWGRVLAWEPPGRVVLSWATSPHWKYEPDPAKASEVEVRFTSTGDNQTRVELEHRHLDRHGEGWESVREAIGGPGGWGGLLDAYRAQ